MTDETLQAIKDGIDQAGTLVKNTVGVLDPALIPLIVLGIAVAQAVPTLIDDVEDWIEKAEPTEEDNANLAKKIAALNLPESL